MLTMAFTLFGYIVVLGDVLQLQEIQERALGTSNSKQAPPVYTPTVPQRPCIRATVQACNRRSRKLEVVLLEKCGETGGTALTIKTPRIPPVDHTDFTMTPARRREYKSWAAFARASDMSLGHAWPWGDAGVVFNGQIKLFSRLNLNMHMPTVGHLPSFIIPGVQKGGTTFLRSMLNQHPNLYSGYGVSGKAEGEAHFFDLRYRAAFETCSKKTQTKTKKKRGMEGQQGDALNTNLRACLQRAYSVRNFAELKSDYAALPPRLAFDVTPKYLHVVDRVIALLPGIPMVILLRDPVDRYRSHLEMEIGEESDTCSEARAVMSSKTWSRSKSRSAVAPRTWPQPGKMQEHIDQFRHDLEQLGRLKEKLLFMSHPIGRGMYATLLQPVFERAGASNLVLRSEDLYADPTTVVAAVEKFVGVPPFTYNLSKTQRRKGNSKCNISELFTHDSSIYFLTSF